MKVDGYPASEYPIAFRILSEQGRIRSLTALPTLA